ncbi:MAG TPA: CAP domain-containing protein, partial [Candidatus Limnocylindria bacterium]|nr:CAP domain-containing protein [Candidatus Limnocylindria bacterium]
MEKTGIIKGILDTEKEWFRSGHFVWLVLGFVIVKLSLLFFLPSQNLSLASDLTDQNILNAVNEQRSLRNLASLKFNDKLALAAQSKSDDMQARHYFAHVDPDGHYVWDKIVAAGYTPYLQLGENLAIEFYDTDSLMAAWMNSPTHRANILQEGFKDQGMGMTLGSPEQGQYYSAITNTFGTLAVPPAPKKITTPPPIPKPSKTPTKTTPATTPPPKTTLSVEVTPPPPPAPAPTPKNPPVYPREGENLAINNTPDFALPQTSANTPSSSPATSTNTQAFSPSAVVGSKAVTKISGFDANRYLI